MTIAEHQSWVRDAAAVRNAVIDRQSQELLQSAQELSPEDLRAQSASLITEELHKLRQRQMARGEQQPSRETDIKIKQHVLSAMYGHGVMEKMLNDKGLTDLNFNGSQDLWVRTTDGQQVQRKPVFASDDELIEWVRRRAATQQKLWDDARPLVEFELDGGHRLSGTLPPVTEKPSLAIRLLRSQDWTLNMLVEWGSMPRDLAALLAAAVRAKLNIFISGETGSGKTALLRALAAEIPPVERVLTVEHFPEMGLDRDGRHPNAVALRERHSNAEGAGEVTLAQLVAATKRMDPDRVILGECLGPEIVDLLDTINQGNDGGLTTLHARSAAEVPGRIATYAARAGLSLHMALQSFASGADIVVHMGKVRDQGRIIKRCVTQVVEVTGFDGANVLTNKIWSYDRGRQEVIPDASLTDSTKERLSDSGWTTPAGAAW